MINNIPDPFSMPVPNGVFADTGEPLPGIDAGNLRSLAYGEIRPDARKKEQQDQAMLKLHASGASFGIVPEVEPDDLEQSGWGVVFSSNADPAIRDALQPLLALREQQAKDMFRVFDGTRAYRPGDTASDWLERHGARMDIVDPMNGVPYYLLLVGGPDEIPLEFQYLLDIHWAVGRLYFDTAAEYRRYAESVAAYERGSVVPTMRQAAVFATRNEGDRATAMFTDQVAVPLTSGKEPRGAIGQRQGFELDVALSDDATKSRWTDLLRGVHGRPALLFSGSHGMVLRPGDPRLKDNQGAMVCQDWPGTGPVYPQQCFSAADVPSDACIHGLIHIFFACFSTGCPEFDTYHRSPNAARLAPSAMFAKLPQAMMAHPNGGALAVLGHVDRAYAYSFVSGRGGAQTQAFRAIMVKLMQGRRIGFAMDEFSVRWASLSAELNDLMRALEYRRTSDAELASMWVARDDARNYIIFGDPAVRLRVDNMARQS